jgi:hypothetical protein
LKGLRFWKRFRLWSPLLDCVESTPEMNVFPTELQVYKDMNVGSAKTPMQEREVGWRSVIFFPFMSGDAAALDVSH